MMRHWLVALTILAMAYATTAKADDGMAVCGEYCHLSCAGIEEPNRGVDLLGPGLWFALPWDLGLHVSIGLGKGVIKNQLGAHESFERSARVGISRFLWRPLFVKIETGGMLAFGEGRKHTAWVSVLPGLSVTSRSGLRAYIGVGPTYLTHPDGVALSGHFQFNVQGGICLVDWSS